MRRGIELIAFLGFSAAVHAAVLTQMPTASGGGAGNGGTDHSTLMAADGGLAELVAHWNASPEVSLPLGLTTPPLRVAQTALPTAPTATVARMMPPSLPSPSQDIAPRPLAVPLAPQAAPQAEMAALALPRFDTAPAQTAPIGPAAPRAPDLPSQPPAPEIENRPEVAADAPESALAVARSERPRARPDRPERRATTPPTPPAASAQPARVAAGEGGQTRQGASQTQPATTTLSAGQVQSLMGQWGARIQARVERSRPRVRAQGTVTLTLRVDRSGRLLALGVSRGSGDTALDQAALQAVRQAGRFPAAPAGLTNAHYTFNLPIRFR